MEAFSVPYLKQVVPPAVTGVSNELVKRIDASIAKNQSVDIQSVLLLCSLDLIGLVGFGHDFGCTRGDVDADVLTMMHVCLKEPTVRFFNPFARFYRLREAAEFNRQLKAFKNFALDVIRANKNPDISGERRKNILSVALSSTRTEKKGHEFSDADLVNEVSTFLFAGHETTGATMCFAILMLGVDHAWQDEARAEVDSVMGDRLIPTFEDQNRLHTLGNIIKEILRLFPAAPGSLRVTQEDTRVLEYTVPKGTNVMPIFMAMQRHPRNFPDAKKFDPTRWEKVESDEGRADEPVSKDESTKSPHTYAYVPFSAGPRNCIGMHFANMEMRLIIARLLRRYTWTIEILEPGVEATPEGIMEYYEEEVTVHAKPFKTHFTVRKNQL